MQRRLEHSDAGKKLWNYRNGPRFVLNLTRSPARKGTDAIEKAAKKLTLDQAVADQIAASTAKCFANTAFAHP